MPMALLRTTSFAARLPGVFGAAPRESEVVLHLSEGAWPPAGPARERRGMCASPNPERDVRVAIAGTNHV